MNFIFKVQIYKINTKLEAQHLVSISTFFPAVHCNLFLSILLEKNGEIQANETKNCGEKQD